MVLAIKGLIPHKLNGVYTGEVLLFGNDIRKIPLKDIAQTVGFVFADPEQQFTSMSVEEELAFAMENVGFSVPEIRSRIEWVSDIAMIGDLLDKSPYDVSGGQKQRIALACAIASKLSILLLDEPTNHLSLRLVTELEQAIPDYPGAIVVASHDRWLRNTWQGKRLYLAG